MLPHFKFATLNDDRLNKLRVLEKQLGVVILALEPDTHKVAALTDEQLTALQDLEAELGTVLVALQAKTDSSGA